MECGYIPAPENGNIPGYHRKIPDIPRNIFLSDFAVRQNCQKNCPRNCLRFQSAGISPVKANQSAAAAGIRRIAKHFIRDLQVLHKVKFRLVAKKIADQPWIVFPVFQPFGIDPGIFRILFRENIRKRPSGVLKVEKNPVPFFSFRLESPPQRFQEGNG